ncbi:MAG: MFS transporter [Actinomycetota bacterium]
MPTDLTPRQRNGVLATMCLALIAVVASVSGLNVALTELSVELEASTAQVLWIVNAYTLTLAALLLGIGELGDRFGRKRILMIGLTVFAVASGLASFVETSEQMIALRALAGVGAAMIMPATLSIITAVFPESERGRAVGTWAGFAGAGGILGLFVSAAIIDNASWPWLFAFPVAMAVASLIATIVAVPDSKNPEVHGYDYLGTILSILAVGGLVLGIHEGPEIGWTAPLTLVGLIVGALATVGFIVWERRTAIAHESGGHVAPVLDVRIFSNRRLAAASTSLTLVFALMFGVFLVVLQYLQAVLGYSALTAAAGLLPMAAVMMSVSPIAPQISDRFGLGTVLGAGSALFAVGFAVMAMADSDPSYLAILPGLIVVGLGMGLAMSPSTTAITESLPAEKQGVASALNDTVREFGSSIGIALIGSLLASGYGSSIEATAEQLPDELAHPVEEGIGQALAVAGQMGDEGVPIAEAARSAFLDGWGSTMWVATALAVVAGVAGVWMARGRSTGTADDLDVVIPDSPAGLTDDTADVG